MLNAFKAILLKRRVIGSLVALYLGCSIPAIAQIILTDDAFVAASAPTTKFGNNVILAVQGPGSSTYLRFSLAGLPSSLPVSSVLKATVTVYVDAVATGGSFDVYSVNGPWSEGSIAYNNAPALGNLLASGIQVSKTGFLALDVTPAVMAWITGRANNGIALVPSPGSSILVTLDSKENPFTSHPAELNLTLASAGAQGPQGLQGPQGPQGPAGMNGPAGASGPAGPQGVIGPMGPFGPMGPAGPAGAQGPVGPLGPTGINNRGVWDPAANYVINDAVSANGSYWMALATNSNSQPSSSNATWQLLAAQGGAGPIGQAGPAGAPGSSGPPGAPGATGPPGATGSAGPQGGFGPTGPSGPPGVGLRVLGEFLYTGSNQTFQISGISQVMVQIWGGGGGGCAGGGGGGGGGFIMAVLPVTDGTYTVGVGAGGAGAFAASSGAASDGSQTQILDSNGTAIVTANGGLGGNCNGGSGGAGGSAVGGGPAFLSSPGAAGGNWIASSYVPGGSAFWGNITPPDGHAGLGGQGGLSLGADPGKPGYVLITY